LRELSRGGCSPGPPLNGPLAPLNEFPFWKFEENM
jgi:hypothetical protein